MEPTTHTLSDLFAQLGLDDDPQSIDRFIAEHRPLPDTVKLAERSSWNGQRAEYSLPWRFSGTREPTTSTMSERASRSSMKASGIRAMRG